MAVVVARKDADMSEVGFCKSVFTLNLYVR